MISSRETAYKVRNLRARPWASYCGFVDGFFGPWVQVEGPVEIVSLPEAMELLVDYYRRAAGEHPDWDDYRAAMERDQRVVIRLTHRARRAERQRLTAPMAPGHATARATPDRCTVSPGGALDPRGGARP